MNIDFLLSFRPFTHQHHHQNGWHMCTLHAKLEMRHLNMNEVPVKIPSPKIEDPYVVHSNLRICAALKNRFFSKPIF